MSDEQSKTEARLYSSYWGDGLLDLLVGVALLTGVWGLFIAWIRNEFVSSVVLPI